TVLEINNKNFYTQVLEGNEKHEHYPSYRCQVGLKFSDIEEASSPAITSLYRHVCQNNNTNFSGPQVLDWDDPYMLEQSLTDIEFRLFLIKIDKYNIYITALECPSTGNADEVEAGVGYTAMFTGENSGKYAIYIQRIDLDGCYIKIYQDGVSKYHYTEHPLTHQALLAQQIPKCDETYWHNKNIINHLYNHFFHRHTISNIQWHKFFIDWKNSSSTIIEFHNSIVLLYPQQYIFKDRELRAWRALLKAAEFTYAELEKKLGISSKTVSSARLYATTNGPGCPALCKPTITRVHLSEELLNQLMTFLFDKNIATPSFYKVDAATGLPHQFFELHPNGMKRTAFMTRLENSKFVYRDDLGGLCLICNEYGFGVFKDMITLVREKIEQKNTQLN
ncbi:7183_t:CDS:2, partial [Racocetra persica]